MSLIIEFARITFMKKPSICVTSNRPLPASSSSKLTIDERCSAVLSASSAHAVMCELTSATPLAAKSAASSTTSAIM